MPHIVVEYSASLKNEVSTSNLLTKLHQTVVDSQLFSPEAVKARAMAFEDTVLPEGATNFMHITVSILTGRSQEERLQLNEAVFNTAKNAGINIDKLSSDIREMDGQVYKK